jgi:hypothetical protein
LVVFQLRRHAQPAIADGWTRDDDCVRQAWAKVQQEHRASAKDVVALHSEWEPSPADATFIRKTFRKAKLTFNFSRPGLDGWDAAFASARHVIAEAGRSQAAQSMDHVAKSGELLPILWSLASPKKDMLPFLPYQSVVPDRLVVGLATVAPTPHGSIGMNHVTQAGLAGRSFDQLLAEALGNLASGLQIDGHTDQERPDKGQLLVVRRSGPFAASALVLPGFHDRMSSLVGQDRLVAGIPDPDTLLVTGADSGWVGELERAVLESPCPASEVVPAVLSLAPSGATVVAERP